MPKSISTPLLALLLAGFAPQPTNSQADLNIRLKDYSIGISYSGVFGITSLRMAAQQADFAHGTPLPIADWEWFWLQIHDEFSLPENPDPNTKLIAPTPAWASPQVKYQSDQIIISFDRPDQLHPGLDLGVEYCLDQEVAEFDVIYHIRNKTGTTLIRPYLMVGLPGFVNHASVAAVSTSDGKTRHPQLPHANFLSEALDDSRNQYLLLRQDVAPREQPGQTLGGSVSLVEQGTVYTLEACYLPDPAKVARAYSAHTNKRPYLTSHLYVFLFSIPPDGQEQIKIHYSLNREPGPPLDFDANGQVGMNDFFRLADAYGRGEPRFDLDGDGQVAPGDAEILLEHFGRKIASNPPPLPLDLRRGDFAIRCRDELEHLATSSEKPFGILGNLTIADSDLSDLEGLENLTYIEGSLSIRDNPSLVTLQGLENLTQIGRLVIRRNPNLADLNGLTQLSRIERNLFVIGNPDLRSLGSLWQLTHVGTVLQLKDNPSLPPTEADLLTKQLRDQGFKGPAFVDNQLLTP